MSKSVKQIVKHALYSIPGIRDFVQSTKAAARFYRDTVSCHIYDAKIELSHTGWNDRSSDYWRLSSGLIWWYHKIEKGICLPPPQRFFGKAAVVATCHYMQTWKNRGYSESAPVYQAAIEVLRAYRSRLDETPPPEDIRDAYLHMIDALIRERPTIDTLTTPIIPVLAPEGGKAILNQLCLARRSVRSFDGTPVDFGLVEEAIKIAQMSPSACNRQPWHVHFYDKAEKISAMLELQNGNAGFGRTIPLLSVITSDLSGFTGPEERIEPALDGGLFLMTFLLALQAVGLSSCCLNWCVLPNVDRRGHELGNIPPNERILTFLGIGRAAEGAVVPCSARRPLKDVVVRH